MIVSRQKEDPRAERKIVGARVISATRVVVKRRKRFGRYLVYLIYRRDCSHIIQMCYNNNDNNHGRIYNIQRDNQ